MLYILETLSEWKLPPRVPGWQTLILGAWKPIFFHLPVESIIYKHQQAYYRAINTATKVTDCGCFIDFILDTIYETIEADDGGAVSGAVNRIFELLRQHPGLRANAIADKLGIPLRTVQRGLEKLKAQGKIEFRGAPKNGGYYEAVTRQ